MAEIELNVEIRSGRAGKKALTQMRKGRKIPGVVYGGKSGNLSVVVGEIELVGALKAGGANALLRLKHAQGTDTVIVKELQRHVVTSRPIHADFQRVSLTDKITVKVPLRVVGEAPGVKLQGGILEHVLREISVRCLADRIPVSVDVDVSAMGISENVTVGSLRVPEGAEVLDDPKHIVVNILAPAAEEEKAPAEGSEAEPEVIAKGKEKGEDGEAAAKPEAAKKEEPKK